MGNTQPMKKINYEDMQLVIKNPQQYLIINTMPSLEQDCLIINTIPINDEPNIINKYLKEKQFSIRIIIYGKNCNDERIEITYNKLTNLGFYNIFIYFGGMFEWLMLQDIYGKELFPTTKKELDLLKYKPKQLLNIELLEYS
jgi:hypothetical protein